MKKKLLFILVVLSIYFIPFTYSKYVEVINTKLVLNIVVPEYDIFFDANFLPEGYQVLEYIEATGTQYIDTGVSMNGNYTLYADGFMTPNELGVLINGYNDSKNRQGVLFYTVSNKYGYYWFGQSYTENKNLTSLGIDLKQRFQFTQDKNGITLVQGSLTISDSYNGNPTTNTQNIYIFETAAKSDDRFGTLYHAKILNGSYVIKNFVPCYRKSDGEIGLFDTVDKIFYTNSGTETFNYKLKSQHFVYNNAQKLLPNTYINDGYLFLGWNTKADGTGDFYENEELVSNITATDGEIITLYAQWETE